MFLEIIFQLLYQNYFITITLKHADLTKIVDKALTILILITKQNYPK